MHANPEPAHDPNDGWNFKFKDFLIGAWYGPFASDEEVQLYKQAGFNVIMVGRYMNNDNSDLNEGMLARHLDLAQKHHLWAMFDTYNNNAWGGVVDVQGKHPAKPEELQWIYERFGDHPALVGILLGDDQSRATERLRTTTDFMRENCPHLMPWICQNHFDPLALVELGNPIANWQMYPTLYNRDIDAFEQMQIFCRQLSKLNRACEEFDLTMWPMFNVVYVHSDNVVRFQVYASLAYASQGIWYFHYKGGLRGDGEEPLDNYKVAAEANNKVADWGARLLGCKSLGIYSTGWTIDGAETPDESGYVTWMSDDLLVGLLKKEGKDPLAMVVDKRLSKEAGVYGDREVKVVFRKSVAQIGVIQGDSVHFSRGCEITLKLKAGEGQLLQLVDTTPKRIYVKPSAFVSGAVDLRYVGHSSSIGYWIYYGQGRSSDDSVYVTEESARIAGLTQDSLYTFRIRSVSAEGDLSAPTPAFAATAGPASQTILLVKGADRDCLLRHSRAMRAKGYALASVEQAAVEKRDVSILDYHIIDWAMSDKRSKIFSDSVLYDIQLFLENGGRLLISGSNIGAAFYGAKAADKEFFRNYFKAVFLYDAPDRTESRFYRLESVQGGPFDGMPPLDFDDGEHGAYNVASPDVIGAYNGGRECMRFVDARKLYKGSCVFFDGPFGDGIIPGKLVYCTIPLETIYPESARKNFVQRVLRFFSQPVGVDSDGHTRAPQQYLMLQNYPNPFNPETTIAFTVPAGRAKVEIFNSLGEKIKVLVDANLAAGRHFIRWEADDDSGYPVAAGVYFCKLKTGIGEKTIKILNFK